MEEKRIADVIIGYEDALRRGSYRDAIQLIDSELQSPTMQQWNRDLYLRFRAQALARLGFGEQAEAIILALIQADEPFSLYLAASSYLEFISPEKAIPFAEAAITLVLTTPDEDLNQDLEPAEFLQRNWWIKAAAYDACGRSDSDFDWFWTELLNSQEFVVEACTMPLLNKWRDAGRFEDQRSRLAELYEL